MIDSMVYSAMTDASLAQYLSHNGVWRVYPRGSLGSAGIPASPRRPYAQYGENNANQVRAVREGKKIFSGFYDLYVYDDPGSYTRIKAIHQIMMDTMVALTDQVAGDGTRIIDMVFNNFGPDGYDTVNQQSAKVATYQCVVSLPT
jgi:hypothetical protein